MPNYPVKSVTDHKYCILELNNDSCILTPPMYLSEIHAFVRNKYGEQPLNYFNANYAIWIIDIYERQIRPLSLKIEI
jgi:hypothetical protein